MKQLIKKYFWLVTIIIAVIVTVTLYCFGFRITYAPELETSWEAVSAVAAWVGVLVSIIGVVASFLAIWYAIKIPKTIAERQDKIALFEKRYECYTVIQNFLALSNQIENLQTIKEIQAAFKIYFSDSEKFHNNESASVLAVELNQQKLLIISGSFLFSHYNDKLLQEIIDTGMDLILAVATETEAQAKAPLSKRVAQLKQHYCRLCNDFEKEYLDAIENELELIQK